MTKEFSGTIEKMFHCDWPNFVLLKDRFWLVASSFERVDHLGFDKFLEFHLTQNVSCQFLKKKYGNDKFINNISLMRHCLSINQEYIVLIQPFGS
jgi:hypothetical protein